MVTVENNENLDPLQGTQGVENNKTVISSIVYTEEERIKIANTEDLHKIFVRILKRDTSVLPVYRRMYCS